MSDTPALLDKLAAVFEQTGHAHHAAFIDTDGVDPEWPLWYADHLHEQLSETLGVSFTKSELVYLLVTVDRELSARAPGADWARYYARFFIDRYAPRAN